MEYLVVAEIEIDGSKVEHYTHIRLRQKFNEHHEFNIGSVMMYWKIQNQLAWIMPKEDWQSCDYSSSKDGTPILMSPMSSRGYHLRSPL